MIRYTTAELEDLVALDAGLGDLTGDLIGKETAPARLAILTRSSVVASHLDAAAGIARLYNLKFESAFKNGALVPAKSELCVMSGEFGAIHAVYKSVQNLLEYACGIALSAREMVEAAKSANPKCEVLLTRKVIPFAKKLCLKAGLEGGARIHRLGTYDTVLFFDHHTCAYGDLNEFLAQIARFKSQLCERKILVECKDVEFGKAALKAGADGVQCDKMSAEDVGFLVKARDEMAPNAVVMAAGGVNKGNAAAYAATLCDALVTSAPYKGCADLGAKIALL